jgi:hypothetical protein
MVDAIALIDRIHDLVEQKRAKGQVVDAHASAVEIADRFSGSRLSHAEIVRLIELAAAAKGASLLKS